MKATIINVGNEILEGDILNSNAQFLSKEIFSLGGQVIYQISCRDSRDELVKVLKEFSAASDLVILTGGLGPTKDDLTKETVSDFLNLKLIPNKIVLEDIKGKFKAFKKEMTTNNIKQSYVIEEAKILFNEKGTAPGFLIESDSCNYILFPGPPRELKYLYETYIEKYLKKLIGTDLKYSEIIKISEIGESTVEFNIKDLIESKEAYIATYATLGEVKVKISSSDRKILNKYKNIIIDRFKENIVGVADEKTSKIVLEKFIEKNITISTAESCTGGLLSSKITDYPGSSSIYSGSFITYNNSMKEKYLNVKKTTLERYGAVSKKTVEEMVKGLYKNMKTDICVAITGIAGPSGGSVEKPVGLVYIGVKIYDKYYILENNFRGSRKEVRHRTTKKVFDFLYQKMIFDY